MTTLGRLVRRWLPELDVRRVRVQAEGPAIAKALRQKEPADFEEVSEEQGSRGEKSIQKSN